MDNLVGRSGQSGYKPKNGIKKGKAFCIEEWAFAHSGQRTWGMFYDRATPCLITFAPLVQGTPCKWGYETF
jgi:hypothetical protein